MSAAAFTLTFVPSEARIDPTLWDACFPPPLEGRWWYAALERSGLDDQFSFLYGLIHLGGAPVGIAPAFVMDFPVALVAPSGLLPAVRWLGKAFRSLVFPRTLFVGSPCADEGTVGLIGGVDRRAALCALQHGLDAKAREIGADLLVWKDFAQSDAVDLDWLSRREGLFRCASFPGTVAALPPGGRDAYFAAMKGSRRHALKKKLRRSRASVELDLEIVRSPDGGTLDELFGLFWQTYEKATTRFERLNRGFFGALAGLPMAHFIVLREKAAGEAVAFMLCFDLEARVINKFIGIDYRRPKQWLLYFRLWDAAVDFALSRGADSVQSGQTGYAPKIETGHTLVPLTNYCAHRNPLIHAVGQMCARRIGWATLDEDLARYLKAHPDAHPPMP
ncbi:MAG: GNAT family N-acetyltransferase [Betaproteobacteria bacterium]|nr:GNAT family N-acetyltransferase [Betaproteobacteria bacterium]